MDFRKHVLAATMAVACGTASAQGLYAGASIGKAFQSGLGDHNPDYSACASTTADQISLSPSLFVGYRLKYIGAEVGAGKLFHSHFAGDCNGVRGSQDLRASQRYLRINGYIPVMGIEIVPFIGRALIKHSNYEVSDARAVGGDLDTHLATGLNNSTFYGLGVQKDFDKFFLRAEAQKMANVAEDPWSQRGWHNDVRTLSIGIGRYF